MGRKARRPGSLTCAPIDRAARATPLRLDGGRCAARWYPGRRAGSVELESPKLRQGSCFPQCLEPRRTAEKALTAVIQEACVQGTSTRSVDDGVKALGMGDVSKRQVSRRCAEFDERTSALLNRQIDGDWPYLWIEATCVKACQASHIVSVAGMVAAGLHTTASPRRSG